MIKLEKLQTTPSKYIRKRMAQMTASVLQVVSDFERVVDVRVATAEPGKVNKIVRFSRDKRGLGIHCFNEENLANCTANKWARPCSHFYKAVELLETIHNEKESEHESTKPPAE